MVKNNVSPLLKPAAWAEVAIEKGLLFSFLPIESVAGGASSVVAYGVEQAEKVVFLPANESNNQKLPEIHAAALASLRSRLAPLDWATVDGCAEVLIFADDFNAAECLLLQERMLEAHTLLDSPRLLACTPKRGILLVCRYQSENKEIIEAFLELCHEIYYEVGGEPISPIVWGVSEGRIKDRMQIGEDYLDYLKNRYAPEGRQSGEVLRDASGEQVIAGSTASIKKTFLYSPGQIAFMTLFGTILAGLYGVFRNYQVLGAKPAARLTVVIGCVLVVLSIFTFQELPDSAYDRLFPILSAIFMGGGCKLIQGRILKEAQVSGASLHRVGNQCLVILMSLLVMLPMVAFLIVLRPSS